MNNRIIAKLSAVILFCFLGKSVFSQDTLRFLETAPSYSKNRGIILGTSLGAGYALSMTGLYQLWYKDYPSSSFHSFDDNNEWLQVDKVGHFGSAYYLGKWGIDLFRWTGMKRKKAIILGGSTGFLFLTTVEIFDGFSEQWGFSSGDMIANGAGSLLAISQQLAWDEQRIKVKFSFHESEYQKYRPDQLGSSTIESLFKDYNGQTYWLSANIHSFLNKDSKFPKWLNIAAGYGADGMTGARFNSGIGEFPSNNNRTRQYYIAPDIDLTKIKTKSRALKTIFGVVGFIKIPAPTLEFREKGSAKMHWLYF